MDANDSVIWPGFTRYRNVYADGTMSDWIRIPDPAHPCYILDEDFDDRGFHNYFTDRYLEDKDCAISQGIDQEILGWVECYLSSYTPTIPIEHNERKLSGNEFECDVGCDWSLRYRYCLE